ncbi:MAG TPA: hypothetical protein VFR28_10615 [Allosphingosinicella sp.]|nr:hypothetical protein [Allosphingosinicella sp.]
MHSSRRFGSRSSTSRSEDRTKSCAPCGWRSFRAAGTWLGSSSAKPTEVRGPPTPATARRWRRRVSGAAGWYGSPRSFRRWSFGFAIFSLNDVPDGEVDPEEGDDSAPFDAPRPGSRPSGGGEAEAWEEVFAGEPWRLHEEEGEEEEKEDEAPAVQHSYSRKDYHSAQAKRELIQSQGGSS